MGRLSLLFLASTHENLLLNFTLKHPASRQKHKFCIHLYHILILFYNYKDLAFFVHDEDRTIHVSFMFNYQHKSSDNLFKFLITAKLVLR